VIAEVTLKASEPNRRKSMRWQVDFAMSHCRQDESATAGLALDLSEEGLAFRSETTYPPGTGVCIRLQPIEAAGAALRIVAIVRHSSKGVTGVEFVDIPEVEKQRILEIIYLAIALRRR
jgi:c-di-GMP-binding flagellar brake protein YcgR